MRRGSKKRTSRETGLGHNRVVKYLGRMNAKACEVRDGAFRARARPDGRAIRPTASRTAGTARSKPCGTRAAGGKP